MTVNMTVEEALQCTDDLRVRHPDSCMPCDQAAYILAAEVRRLRAGLAASDARLHDVAVHCANVEAERDALRAALDGMLQVYGGSVERDGLPKHETELDLIEKARAALSGKEH